MEYVINFTKILFIIFKIFKPVILLSKIKPFVIRRDGTPNLPTKIKRITQKYFFFHN